MDEDLVLEAPATSEELRAGCGSLSLLARLGGRRTLDRVVEHLYHGVLGDPLLAPVFAGLDLQKIKAHQRRFLAQVLSGEPLPEPGLLRRVHAGLVQRHGLEDRHFDAVAAHLSRALDRCGAAVELQQAILAIVAGTRVQVLGR
jgi:hemoglobin